MPTLDLRENVDRKQIEEECVIPYSRLIDIKHYGFLGPVFFFTSSMGTNVYTHLDP